MLKKLNTLPRDSRDTLFLLFVIAWVILPQVSNLPLWCSVLAAGVLLWRGWLAYQSQPLPSRWWLLALLIITVAATVFTHRTVLGRDAGVTMIVVLLALKTLELRAKRDAFVIFFLSFFTMLTNFFFSQSLLTAAAMLIALLGLLTALVNTHMPVGKPPLLQAAKTAGWMALLGAPVMAVLFLLFPRMAPLWGVPGDAMSGRSGLSNSMQVGNIASLALDESIAMRVRFTGAVPPQSDLYFRGPVLSTFDGREWRPLRSGFPPRMQAAAELRVSGSPIQYEVTLEPNSRTWLLLLDAAPTPPKLPGFEVSMTPELQWQVDRPITELTRYAAQSFADFRFGPQRAVASLQDFVDLPPGYNPRTLQLAAQMRRDPALANANGAQLVAAVLERLRTGGYSYTLDPGVFGQHAADEFWFDRKEGFCEHIASSFVLLMRALDVPARVVTGYQGGERNAVDGFWTIRQSDAHAWAEVWMAGRGWVRVDPTTAVAPGRTGSFQRLQAPRGVIASALNGAFGTVSPTLLASARAAWEAMNNGWNQWVLNYSEAKQLNLLKNIGFDSPSWEDLGYVLAGLVVFVSLCGAAWTLWERTRHDPWLRLLAQAARRLEKAGITLAPNSPPRRMAEQLQQQQQMQQMGKQMPQPHDAPKARSEPIREWLLRLEALRYAPMATSGHNTRHSLARLQREFRQLPWPK
jgi:transglutaminase-like putative cysteine protease